MERKTQRERFFRSRNGFLSIVSERNARITLVLQFAIQEPNENVKI